MTPRWCSSSRLEMDLRLEINLPLSPASTASPCWRFEFIKAQSHLVEVFSTSRRKLNLARPPPPPPLLIDPPRCVSPQSPPPLPRSSCVLHVRRCRFSSPVGQSRPAPLPAPPPLAPAPSAPARRTNAPARPARPRSCVTRASAAATTRIMSEFHASTDSASSAPLSVGTRTAQKSRRTAVAVCVFTLVLLLAALGLGLGLGLQQSPAAGLAPPLSIMQQVRSLLPLLVLLGFFLRAQHPLQLPAPTSGAPSRTARRK